MWLCYHEHNIIHIRLSLVQIIFFIGTRLVKVIKEHYVIVYMYGFFLFRRFGHELIIDKFIFKR